MRSVCPRCRRPLRHCYCALIPSLPTRTRVVFLQHPRERRVPVSTCRMAHLALPNSELHVGVHFGDHPAVRALAASDDAALLYPSETTEASLPQKAPGTLVVIDGTWTQAKKVLARNPALQQLRRVALHPTAPGNYRIRREPAPHCLSTVEAVSQALRELEGGAEAFDRMLEAFDFMVERQLDHARAHLPTSRRRRATPRRKPSEWLPREAVLVQAEANSPAPGAPARFEPELVQVVAVRVATGERFSSLARPTQPLSPGTPRHLELDPDALLAAPARSDVIAALGRFLRPEDVLATWGTSTGVLLSRSEASQLPSLDVRLLWRRQRKGRTGGVEEVARWLGADPLATPPAEGRGGRRLAALLAVVRSEMTPQPAGTHPR